MKRKKLLSIFLCICMVLSLLPTYTVPVFAAVPGVQSLGTPDPIEPATVPEPPTAAEPVDHTLFLYEGKVLKDTKFGEELTDTGIVGSVNPAGGYTYTFTDVNFATTGLFAVSMQDTGSVTVELVGTNQIRSGNKQSGDQYSVLGGLVSTSTSGLEITGDGSLYVYGGNGGGNSAGIYSYNPLSVSGGRIYAYGGNVSGASYGIYAKAGLTVTGGEIYAFGGDVTKLSTYTDTISAGIRAKGMTVSGGRINATGGESEYYSYGIRTMGDRFDMLEGDLTVTGGDITAFGGAVDANAESGESDGICVRMKMTVQGGNITATGGRSSFHSYGITVGIFDLSNGEVAAYGGEGVHSIGVLTGTDDPMTISGGTLTAMGGNAFADNSNSDSYGIYAYGEVAASGGTVKAIGGDAASASYGIYGRGKGVTVSGGELTTATGKASYCMDVRTAADVLLQGGSLTLSGSAAPKDQVDSAYGIYAQNLTIQAGKLVINTGDAASVSYGIYAQNLTVNDGEVTVTGGKAVSSYGIYLSNGGMTVVNGSLTATGGAASDSSYGIYNRIGPMTVSGGVVNVLGGDVTGVGEQTFATSYGIYLGNSSLRVTAGSVTAKGGTVIGGQTMQSTGMLLRYGLKVSGGRVEGLGGRCEGTSFGISHISGSADITGGSVIASGDTYSFNNKQINTTGGKTVRVYANTENAEPGSVLTEWKGDGSDEVTGYKYIKFMELADYMLVLNAGGSAEKGYFDKQNEPLTADALASIGITWDGEKYVFTDVNFVTTAATAVWIDGDVTVKLVGSSIVEAGDSKENTSSVGLWAPYSANLTLVGDGSLAAYGGNTENAGSYGVAIVNGLTLTSGKLYGYGGASQLQSYGIRLDDKALTVTGGELYGYGGDVSGSDAGSNSYGISVSGETNISGGTVEGIGGDVSSVDADDNSYGIYIGGTADISGGTVKGIGGDVINSEINGYDNSYGICIGGTADISGGSVTGEGGRGNRSEGVSFFGNNNIISGGIVYGEGAEAVGVSAGVITDNMKDLTVTGGSVTGIGGVVVAIPGISGGSSYGIRVSDDSTLSGGTVYGKGGDSGYDSVGIALGFLNSAVEISGTADVTGIGGSAGMFSTGIYFMNDTEIKGGKVTATAGDVSTTYPSDTYEYRSCGIRVYKAAATGPDVSFKISGGSVTAAAGSVAEQDVQVARQSIGIYVIGSMEVSDGTVTATADAAQYSYGIYTENKIVVTGDKVNVTGGSALVDSYGIYSLKELTVSDGADLTAVGGAAKNFSYGISIVKDITISGGSVTATGGGSEWVSMGLYSSGHLMISGGEVAADGGKVTSTNPQALSAGIRSGLLIQITGGNITANGGEASSSYGLAKTQNDISITGGVVTATGKTAALNDAPMTQNMRVYAGQSAPGSSLADWKGDGSDTVSGYNYMHFKEMVKYTIVLQDGKVYKDEAEQQNLLTGIGITYDTGAYVFENVDFMTTADTAVNIKDADATILLKGENIIKGGGTSGEYHFGIEATGSLTVKGEGSLEVYGGNVYEEDSRTYGIYTEGSFTLESGSVKAVGGDASESVESCGVYAGSGMMIKGGSLQAVGGDAKYYTYGICTNGSMTVTNGEVTATSGNVGDGSDVYTYGIFAKELTVSGGSVKATSGEAANADSCGIYAVDQMTVNGGTVEATAQTGKYSTGIMARSAAFAGGEITATAADAIGENSVSYGMYVGMITVSGGEVTATAGDVIGQNSISFGIYYSIYSGTAAITGGVVEVFGGQDAFNKAPKTDWMKVYGGDTAPGEELTEWVGDTGDDVSGHKYMRFQELPRYTLVLKDGKVYKNEAIAANEITVQGISYQNGEYVFTNVTFETKAEVAVLIADSDASIRLVGDNRITQKSPDGAEHVRAIKISENLTLTGDGKLTAAAGDGVYSSFGIANDDSQGSLVINGGDITATGGSARNASGGIYMIRANFALHEGTVKAYGAETTGNSYGIHAKNIEIHGGKLDAVGKAQSERTFALSAVYDLLIDGGEVTAIAGNAGNNAYAIIATASIQIDGGKVIAKAGDANTSSYGIHFGSSIWINEGDILATSGTVTAQQGNSRAVNKAPKTLDTLVDAGTASDGSDADRLNTWTGDGSDDITSYRYMHFTPDPVKSYTLVLFGGKVYKNEVGAENEITRAGIKWDAQNGRYLLENEEFETRADIALKILDQDAVLHITGWNRFRSGDVEHGSIAVQVGEAGKTGSLTLTGDGTFSAVCGNIRENHSYGVQTYYDLTVDGPLFNLSGGHTDTNDSSTVSYALFSEGNITLKNGTLFATGGNSYGSSYGIYLEKTLKVEDGWVIAVGGRSGNGNSYAICGGAESAVVVNGGTLDVTASSAKYNSYGIYVGEVKVEDGELIVNGGEAEKSCGIMASAVTVNGGKVSAIGGESVYNSYGFKAVEMTVNAGEVVAISGAATRAEESDHGSNGISADKLLVNGGSITATGGKVNTGRSLSGQVSAGVKARDLTVTAGEIKATGGESECNSYGILVLNQIDVSGGKIEATGGSGGKSCGLRMDASGSSTFHMSGGEIKAIGGTGPRTLSYGMYVNTDAVLSGGKIEATGGNATGGYDSYGAYFMGTLTLKQDAVLSGRAGQAEDGLCTGVFCYGDVLVDSGSLTGVADQASAAAYVVNTGIEIMHDLTVKGGSVVGMGGKADNSVGIEAVNLTVDGGLVHGSSSDASRRGSGIEVYDTLTVNGGSVIADAAAANTTPEVVFGIAAVKLAVNGGKVESTAKAQGTALGYGVIAKNSFILTGGEATLAGSTLASAKGQATRPDDIAAFAPTAEKVGVLADRDVGGAGAVMLEDWVGDGSDDVSAYQYLKLDKAAYVDPTPAVQPIMRMENFATTVGEFLDQAYYAREARAGDIVTLKVSLSALGERYGLDYRKIKVVYEVEGAAQLGGNYDYHGHPIYKDGIATDFMLSEGFNKMVAKVYYAGVYAGEFEPFYTLVG